MSKGFIRSKFGIGPDGLSGKFYYEFTINEINGNGIEIGFVDGIVEPNSTNSASIATNCYLYKNNGDLIVNGTTTSNFGDTFTNDDIIGTAIDKTNGKIWFFKNGICQGNVDGNPQLGVFPAASNVPTNVDLYPVFTLLDNNNSVTLNSGETNFQYDVPGGYTKGVYNYSTNDSEWITIGGDDETGYIDYSVYCYGPGSWNDLVLGNETISGTSTGNHTIGYDLSNPSSKSINRIYYDFQILEDEDIRGKTIIDAKFQLYRQSTPNDTINIYILKSNNDGGTAPDFTDIDYTYVGDDDYSDHLGKMTISQEDDDEIVESTLNHRGIKYLNEILNPTSGNVFLKFMLLCENDFLNNDPGSGSLLNTVRFNNNDYLPRIKCKVID